VEQARETKRAQKTWYALQSSNYESEKHHHPMFKPNGPSRSRLRNVLTELSSLDGDLLLDMACGTGNVISEAKVLFDKVVGIDLSQDMISIAKQRTNDLLVGDVDYLPIKSNIASVVTCYSALHHMETWGLFFQEVYRVLRDGGVFFTDWDPNGPEDCSRLLINWFENGWSKIRRWQLGNNEMALLESKVERYKSYSKGFSAINLAGIMRSCGFSEVNIYYHNDSPDIAKTNKSIKEFIYYLARCGIFLKWPKFNQVDMARYFAIIATK
jgi:ubiquinone/menaquinone biosynthesis C-methylase UbiE